MRYHVSAFCTLPLLFVLALSQSIPYRPASILLSADSHEIAYAFLPITDSTTTQFVSLNISSTLNLSNLTFEVITPDLPFTTSGTDAFIPSISAIGEISVYSGPCSTNTSSTLWRFTPSNTSSIGNGTWGKETTTTAGDITSAALPGADFLAGGFSFSTFVKTNASETNIYLFGGMCPTSSATTATWQSAASYSNHMLRLMPTVSSSKANTYMLDVTSSRGPPIAEAGFTITGLTPTYSNATGVETQQQSYVLIGGHTQGAFINSSQVALFSLPEEGWSFMSVDSPSPSSNPNTELAIKSTFTSVDSRSGHSAVLSEDGSKIIVYGGWVGDLTQAADPQLAVLNLGTGYGGRGNWRWSVPTNQPSGDGIYGHGAVMLPGNVMMVLGGFNISASGNTKRATTTSQAMFFNATSMEWVSSYTNPNYVAALASSSASAAAVASKKSTSTKLGLGLGLGLGFALVILIVLCCLFCLRRTRKRREAREEGLGRLDGAERSFHHEPNRQMVQSGAGVFPWSNNRWNNDNSDTVVDSGPIYDSNSAVAGYESLQNVGNIGPVPKVPRQITRKPVNSRARGSYGPAPTSMEFNSAGLGPSVMFGRANSLSTAGAIHPIYEADEDGSQYNNQEIGVALGEPSVVRSSSRQNRHSDPFRDPPPTIVTTQHHRDSHASSEIESPAESRQREIQEWVSDWAAADVLLNNQIRHSQAGRVSPTRRAQLIAQSVTVHSVSGEEDSGRTESNLSERSARSLAFSNMTISRSGSSSQGRSRADSLRGVITGLNPFGSTVASTTGPSTTLSPVFDRSTPQGPRNRPPGSSGSASSKSFNTAHTSFPALQAEGESLLPRPDELSPGEYSPTRSQADSVGSPSKSKPITRTSWLGSLRRVFVADSSSDSQSPDHSYHSSSRENSPARYDYVTGSASREPRRTVSAGATLWRRKQGKEDWEDSAENPGDRSNTFTGELSSSGMREGRAYTEDDYDEWDIERAVERRVVQVMFTVPKEKLRVVNQDINFEGSEVGSTPSGSLRSKKGSGKRSLRDCVLTPPEPEPLPVVGSSAPLLKEHDEDEMKDSADIADEKEEELKQEKKEDKGKGIELEGEKSREESRTPSPTRRAKGKVAEIIELMEGRSSPEH